MRKIIFFANRYGKVRNKTPQTGRNKQSNSVYHYATRLYITVATCGVKGCGIDDDHGDGKGAGCVSNDYLPAAEKERRKH